MKKKYAGLRKMTTVNSLVRSMSSLVLTLGTMHNFTTVEWALIPIRQQSVATNM